MELFLIRRPTFYTMFGSKTFEHSIFFLSNVNRIVFLFQIQLILSHPDPRTLPSLIGGFQPVVGNYTIKECSKNFKKPNSSIFPNKTSEDRKKFVIIGYQIHHPKHVIQGPSSQPTFQREGRTQGRGIWEGGFVRCGWKDRSQRNPES